MSTKTTGRAIVSASLLCFMLATEASGQLFGPRSFGRSLSRSAGPRLEADAGTIRGNERFLRGNRRVADFVGSDRSDTRGFVGMQSTGRQSTRSAADGVREQSTVRSSLNSPLRPPASGDLYHPKLRYADEPLRRPGFVTAETLTEQLSGFQQRRPGARIEVLVEGQTAILRGEVASSSDRALVERMIGFEPGIAKVRNELRVRPRSIETDSQRPRPTPIPPG